MAKKRRVKHKVAEHNKDWQGMLAIIVFVLVIVLILAGGQDCD